jgi:ribonuclease Z
MKIIFTGTGTPIIDPKYLRACASEVLLIGNDALLFDCGRWVSMRLFESEIGIDPINYLFLTHHHHDHTADLPQLTCRRSINHLMQIYGPRGTKEAIANIKEVFDKPLHPEKAAGKIEVYDIDTGFVCKGDSWSVKAVSVTHIYQPGELALAYRIDSDDGSVVISGDVTAIPLNPNSRLRSYSSNLDLKKLAKNCDIYVMDADIIHTTPKDIGVAAQDSGAKKIVLTHIQNPGFTLPKPIGIDRKMPELIQPSQENFKKSISQFYTGEIIFAEDLATLEV